MYLLWCKGNVKRLGLNNIHQDFDIRRIVHTVMNACQDNKSIYIYIYILAVMV